MDDSQTLLIFSDVHYASEAEKQRGSTELQAIRNPALRWFVVLYRHFLWRRDPFAQNHLLDLLIDSAETPDYVVANGDYSCDTAFVGVSDPACFESVRQCLDKLRSRFGSKLWLTLGDHELGKMSLFGGIGGARLASMSLAEGELGLKPFWKFGIGNYLLLGVTSSLLALPVFEVESLHEERHAWQNLRNQHFQQIREVFAMLKPQERVVLFCHDPTALPFLWQDEMVRSRLSQIEVTIIGHLHSELFLRASRTLAGMPTISFLGNSVRRMSRALHEAKTWRPFNVRLCPSLGGIELLQDGGYYRVLLDPNGRTPLRFELRPLKQKS